MENLDLFTDEEIKKMKLTEEELNTLEDAANFCNVSEALPDDVDGFYDKLDKTFTKNDFQDAFEKMGELSKTDPEFFKQIVALNEVLNDVKE